PYDKIDINAPFSMAFETVGWKWAKYVVDVRALKGMTSALLVGAVGQARQLYLTLAETLYLMQPYDKININAPFSMAFEAVEWKWTKYVVAIGALKGMTSVLLVGAVGQAW
ncbi:hypothetical protein Tco_0932039, partial [Tanacetum coccineum]